MATREQLLIWLEQAENAYHSIITGGAVRVFVDQNEERIEYQAANATRLLAYINELKRQLGIAPYGTGQSGPMQPWW